MRLGVELSFYESIVNDYRDYLTDGGPVGDGPNSGHEGLQPFRPMIVHFCRAFWLWVAVPGCLSIRLRFRPMVCGPEEES